MASKTTETAGLLDDDRRGRRAREAKASAGGLRAWRGTLSDRLRVAKRLPQAVLKISSHNHGVPKVRARLRYISRDGSLPIETDEGLQLEGPEVDRLVDDWAADFSNRTDSRDTMSLVVSLPAGSDQKAAMGAAREFFAETFAENHEYVFAGHDDTDHFHIHLVVKARGRDGKALRTTRRDPQLWRQSFAERARYHGIELDASPRTARGVGRRTPPTAIVQIRERGELPRTDQLAVKEALRGVGKRAPRPTASERVIRAINDRERLIFAEQALSVAKHAKSIKEDDRRLKALEMASELAAYAEGMPVPESRREALLAVSRSRRGRVEEPDLPGAVLQRVKQTERAIRDQVKSFASVRDQRTAIAARSRLSSAVQERQRGRDIER